ncbi:MAG: glutamate--cysteine ligase [Actinomycetota bacterium]
MEIDFNQSERASLGVEMEFALVDRETGALVSAGSDILAVLGDGHPDGVHPKAKAELFECTVEVITDVCTTVAEARADLAGMIDVVSAEAEGRGLALVCVGTHPFSRWRDQKVSPNPRYADLVEEMQWPAWRLQIFGVHFHVGVRSAEKSIAIANALCAYLPHLLALAASSPYWEGQDTGLASCRTKVFEALPTAGLPYRMADWAEFEQFMETLVNAEAIRTIREVWWDIRPHPIFGTVELRMCDGIPTLREVTALAALAQSLVEWLDRRIDAGEELPAPSEWVVRENKWLAARHGVDARLIVDERGNRRPARDEIVALVDELAPVAGTLGCSIELTGVTAILDHGPSYERQRAVVERGGSLTDVVASLVAELASDCPGAVP